MRKYSVGEKVKIIEGFHLIGMIAEITDVSNGNHIRKQRRKGVVCNGEICKE
ncbi:hypothetical protein SMD22_01320 (plasmid) [Brevibacillus halotolerans]|nr:hypothetical protein SMD22_01320 [Brevibacillus halotolerans]